MPHEPPSDEQSAFLAAAAAQLELALHESAGPVDALGQSVERMSVKMSRLSWEMAFTGEEAHHASCRDIMQELSVFTENLQFYDRLVQHLSHLREFLLGLSGSAQLPEESEQRNAVRQELRGMLRQCLISEGQRELLDLILPPPEAPARRTARFVDEGSIELF